MSQVDLFCCGYWAHGRRNGGTTDCRDSAQLLQEYHSATMCHLQAFIGGITLLLMGAFADCPDCSPVESGWRFDQGIH